MSNVRSVSPGCFVGFGPAKKRATADPLPTRWVEGQHHTLGVCDACKSVVSASRLRPLNELSPYLRSHLPGCNITRELGGECDCPTDWLERRKLVRLLVKNELKNGAWACDDCAPELFGRVGARRDDAGVRVPGSAATPLASDHVGPIAVEPSRATPKRRRRPAGKKHRVVDFLKVGG